MEKVDLQTKVFEWIQVTAEKIGDFATKEVPPFIHEYLQWKFFESALPITLYCVYLVVLLISIFLFVKPLWVWGLKMWDEADYSNCKEFAITLPATLTGALILITCCSFPYEEIKTCVQIKIAPKVYLIEKASSLLQNQ